MDAVKFIVKNGLGGAIGLLAGPIIVGALTGLLAAVAALPPMVTLFLALFAFGIGLLVFGEVGRRRVRSVAVASPPIVWRTGPPVFGPPAPTLPSPKAYVGEGVTPQYLIDLYNAGTTTLQKDQNVSRFIGMWMRVSGTVSDLRSDPPGLEFEEFDGPILTKLDMWFDDEKKDQVATQALKSRLTVEGQIDVVLGISVRLRHCRIVETARAFQ